MARSSVEPLNCTVKKILSQLNILRQPASAEFSQLLVLSLYNKKLRFSYKNKLRELKNLLKLVALNCEVCSFFFFLQCVVHSVGILEAQFLEMCFLHMLHFVTLPWAVCLCTVSVCVCVCVCVDPWCQLQRLALPSVASLLMIGALQLLL